VGAVQLADRSFVGGVVHRVVGMGCVDSVVRNHLVLGVSGVVVFLRGGGHRRLGQLGRAGSRQAHGQSQAQFEQPQSHQAP
jgi:hypothetical protein